MKKLLFLFTLGATFLAIACNQKPATTNATESVSAASDIENGKYCYEYRLGQDVTTVDLVINGNNITGEMNWLPFEKDGGRGTLQGTRNGKEISAVWTYIIEGSNQTEEVLFKMEGDQLLRKIGELVDPNYDGNLKLKDPATATYSDTYTKVACQ